MVQRATYLQLMAHYSIFYAIKTKPTQYTRIENRDFCACHPAHVDTSGFIDMATRCVDGVDMYKLRDSAVCYELHGGNGVENYLVDSANCSMTAFCRSVAFFITST